MVEKLLDKITDKLIIAPKPTGFLYFERKELGMLVASTVVICMPVCLLYFLGLIVEMLAFLVVVSVLIFVMFIRDPLLRARFINQGGIYEIKRGCIALVYSNGKRKEFSVLNMRAKICRRGKRYDLILGKNIVDFLKHYGNANQAGVGLYGLEYKELDNALAMLDVPVHKNGFKFW